MAKFSVGDTVETIPEGYKGRIEEVIELDTGGIEYYVMLYTARNMAYYMEEQLIGIEDWEG